MNTIQHPIPSIFCWTKVGSEAGQSLQEILCRKEFERTIGGGTFCWGVGTSLGKVLKIARKKVPKGEIDILFTPMKSSAKLIDKSPSELLLWLSYWDEHGNVTSLPRHMIVSSRRKSQSGHIKKNHYALVCSSNQKINLMKNEAIFDANLTRNFISHNAVGASQVTALVRYLGRGVEKLGKPYHVAFRARFYDMGFIKLAEPVEIQGRVAKLYTQLNAAKSVQEWENTASLLKSEARLKNLRDRSLLADSVAA